MFTVTLRTRGETPHVEIFDTRDEAAAFARRSKEWAYANAPSRTLTATVREVEYLPTFEGVMGELLR